MTAACTCFWTDPATWTRYGDAVEPGSQMEPNPECPVHFGAGVGGVQRPQDEPGVRAALDAAEACGGMVTRGYFTLPMAQAVAAAVEVLAYERAAETIEAAIRPMSNERAKDTTQAIQMAVTVAFNQGLKAALGLVRGLVVSPVGGETT